MEKNIISYQRFYYQIYLFIDLFNRKVVDCGILRTEDTKCTVKLVKNEIFKNNPSKQQNATTILTYTVIKKREAFPIRSPESYMLSINYNFNHKRSFTT